MDRYNNLMNRAQEGECILIDGATGTEVERRGVPKLDNAWNGGGALSHPEIVKQIHKDYIQLGAEIVISNTFATTKHALRDANQENNFEALNRRGVELAVQAREELGKDNILVAGGISYWTWTGNKPTLKELELSVTEQAQIMREAGADFIMLEMMIDIDQMVTTFEAAKSSGLPVWIGLTCEPNQSDRMCLRDGDDLEDVINQIKSDCPDVINIMHTEVEFVDRCLTILQNQWNGLVGVYAHSGQTVDGKWTFEDVISAKEYCEYSAYWKKKGVSFIGGCCGVHTDHINLIQKELFS
tara:strand:+ start:377 stop:1270 length:894 start_codon:yes stop_codon:yes gene_type:complete